MRALTNFEEVYAVYFDDVYRYLLSLSGSESTAEELTSETFFRAMDALDRFRGECSVRVWLCQIAKNRSCGAKSGSPRSKTDGSPRSATRRS